MVLLHQKAKRSMTSIARHASIPRSLRPRACWEAIYKEAADADGAITAVPVGGSGGTAQLEPPVKPKPRPPSHYLWVAQETGEGVGAEPYWDLANQSPPDYPGEQRIIW